MPSTAKIRRGEDSWFLEGVSEGEESVGMFPKVEGEVTE
jgi:hypothetical protein